MNRLLVVLLTLSSATWAFASIEDRPIPFPFKGISHVGINPAFDIREGGEDIATAVPIPFMPFSDTGATCDNIDTYDEVCPYSNSTSPDVVYSYTPISEELLKIDLCFSSYDTKLYVYENDEFSLVGCNDDFWYDPPCYTYSSYLQLIVAPGNTYFVVVDGYGGDCGTYQIDCVTESYIPCVVECDPNAVPEGEPELVLDYVDNYNGGCISTPYTFQEIHWIDEESGCAHLTGVSGWYPYLGSQHRDTDWYEVVAAGTEITVAIETDNELTLTRCTMTTANPSCTGYEYLFQTSEILACEERSWTVPSIPGAFYWIFVAPAALIDGPLEFTYCLEVCGINYDVVPTEEVTWGSVKSLYK